MVLKGAVRGGGRSEMGSGTIMVLVMVVNVGESGKRSREKVG